MRSKTNYSELIQDYLSDKLKGEQLKRFENEIKTNAALAKELDLEKDLNTILKQEDVIDLRRKLIKQSETYKNTKKETPVIAFHTKRRRYIIAASFALAVLIGGSVYLMLPKKYTNKKLFSMYYNSNNIIDISRSGNDNLVEAIRKYEQKDYKNALIIFNEVLKKNKKNIAIRFYTGISSIETQNYSKAVKSFKYIIADNNNLYVEHAKWYLGLCYLKNDSINQAISEFKAISKDTTNYHQKEAVEILKKIKRLKNN